VDLLWEDSGEYFQAFEEKLSCLKKGDLAIAVVPDLKEGLIACLTGLTGKPTIRPAQFGAV